MCRRLVHVCLPCNNNDPRVCIWLAHACMKANAIPIPCSATELMSPQVCEGYPSLKLHPTVLPIQLASQTTWSWVSSSHTFIPHLSSLRACALESQIVWSQLQNGRWLWIRKLLSSFYRSHEVPAGNLRSCSHLDITTSCADAQRLVRTGTSMQRSS